MMKYLPVFPDRFVSLAHARQFLDEFVHACNHHHRHTGIGMHTPADVHYGLAEQVMPRESTSFSIRLVETPRRYQVATTVVRARSARRRRSSSQSGK